MILTGSHGTWRASTTKGLGTACPAHLKRCLQLFPEPRPPQPQLAQAVLTPGPCDSSGSL